MKHRPNYLYDLFLVDLFLLNLFLLNLFLVNLFLVFACGLLLMLFLLLFQLLKRGDAIYINVTFNMAGIIRNVAK